MTILGCLVVNLFSFIFGSGIGTYFAQRLFEHRLNKKMYRFTKIYSDKIDIIREFYKLLVKAEKGLEILMNRKEPDDNIKKEEFKKLTFDEIDNFFDYFDENEIVFESQIVDLTNQLRHKFSEARKTHNFATMMESDRGTIEWGKAINNKIEAQEQFVVREIPVLKMILKKEFQERYHLLQS